jgi:tRNA threonylcarbamoyl adenosine modification protein (Sua5/YciO/YrdC/YwlC family)
MRAPIFKISPWQPEAEKIKTVAEILCSGGLAIIPTETVYGVAADRRNAKAVSRLYKIKQRPESKPFSLLIDSKENVEDFTNRLQRPAFKLIDKFWPGPLTLILPAKNNQTIGLRMPDNQIALKLIAAVGAPLVCPSANLSGRLAPKDLNEALKHLGDSVEAAIDGGQAKLGIESSVVDLTQTPYEIRRQGAISSQEIERTVKNKVVLFVCTGNSCRSVMAKAFLEKRLKQEKRDDIEVFSAGILGIPDLRASQATSQVLAEEGINVKEHRSTRINRLMIKKADIILVMEKMHEEKILELVPQAKTRLFLLKEFAKTEGNSLDISDPIGKPLEFHQAVFSLIKQAVNQLIKVL